MSQSCLISNISVLASVPRFCRAGFLSSHLSSLHIFTYVPAAYWLNFLLCPAEFVYVYASSQVFSPFLNLLLEVLLHCYLCHADVSHITWWIFSFLLPLWCMTVYCDLCTWSLQLLYASTIHHLLTAHLSVHHIGKDNESLWVSLPFRYLPWHAFRASNVHHQH